MTFQTTLTRDDVEIAVSVEYDYNPPSVGRRDGRGGPPLEPDEPAYVDVVAVERVDGTAIELTKDEEGRIEDKCWDHLDKLAEREMDYQED